MPILGNFNAASMLQLQKPAILSGIGLVYYFAFGSQSYTEALLRFGWYKPEFELVWSEGNRSCIFLPITRPKRYTLCICIEPFSPAGRVSSFYLVVNGVNYGLFEIKGKQKTIKLSIGGQLLPSSHGISLDFFHMGTGAPADYGGKDERRLNIGLRSIEILVDDIEITNFDPQDMILSRFTPCEARRIREKYVHEIHEKNRINSDKSPLALSRSIEFFIYGYGGNQHDRKSVAHRIWERCGGTSEVSVLVTQWRLPRALVESVNPKFEKFLLNERNMNGVAEIATLPARENSLYDPQFSDIWREYIPSAFDRKVFPAEKIFKYSRADLLATDRQFMIFDFNSCEYFPGCNPASLSKLSIPSEIRETDRPVVLLQDLFDCSNIAHFLFDSCLRAFQYCISQPDLRSSALFVLGGRPTEFHEIALRAIASMFELTDEQFLFPRDAVRLRSSEGIYWFSDHRNPSHPAQGFRPEAVEALQLIAARMLATIARPDTTPEKIYISRSDAGLRRLANEDEVVNFLAAFGFQKIVMSEHSWADQIAILANAKAIVAPHGMGLTLLALNLLRPRVVEIFNPKVGSEAYALLSKAYGNDYIRVVGKETDPHRRDFVVDITHLKSIFD